MRDCKGHPKMQADLWEIIKDAQWCGGWEIDGTMHWLALDHPGTGGRVAWHLFADGGEPFPDHWIRCHVHEDQWVAVSRGRLDEEKNCIRKDEFNYCFVNTEGGGVEIIEWIPRRRP